jgi:hypothetical protein
MTIDEATAEATTKAAELTKELGYTVEPLILKSGEDIVVGFLKIPNREAKRAVLDELMKSPTSAGKIYLECALIKEKSDPRISSNSSEHDAIVMGAEMACIPKIELYQSEVKKK